VSRSFLFSWVIPQKPPVTDTTAPRGVGVLCHTVGSGVPDHQHSQYIVAQMKIQKFSPQTCPCEEGTPPHEPRPFFSNFKTVLRPCLGRLLGYRSNL